jgi:FtsP/CotA-like multicopper oxidase with cupredoxin domain
MYLPEDASRARRREAQNARNNRAEIVRALSTGQVSRRELFKWGILTSAGALANINGLSPFASSAYAAIPTGVPRSDLWGALPFSQPMPRLSLQKPLPLKKINRLPEVDVGWPTGTEARRGRRLSYHTDFTASGGTTHKNPLTKRGPLEGRPPGEYFAQQRWTEYLPKVGYVMSLGRLASGQCFHPNFPFQNPDQVWTYGSGPNAAGMLPPPLIKVRYGEPVLFRVYNRLPVDRTYNGGFGSNSQTVHNHNAHSGSSSDGASNAHFFPGQFYDYHWGTTLARADMINSGATDRRASGPNGSGGLTKVAGDYRELQSSLWFHDHRFFYTAENVYKGNLGALNYYSGPDRGHERLDDGVNLRLPSGRQLDWGNIDFDVNLIISDAAHDPDGQYFFDIFDTDGFLGDLMLVNFAYKPYFEVLPRKYRFRMLCASMSRFVKLAFVNQQNNTIAVKVIANDGNLLVKPVPVTILDQMGPAERFDVVVDFSAFQKGDRIRLVNTLQFKDGRGPDAELSLFQALQGSAIDPGVGPLMEFRVVDEVESVDVPGVTLRATDPDYSMVPGKLTDQIPVVAPVRERRIEFKGVDTGEQPEFGECFPDCNGREAFPWTVRINGESTHFLNANRSSLIVPKPGEVEHWTLINGTGGGWDHPVHLHFEEAVTINRGNRGMHATEALARKDVWRLKTGLENNIVKIQVRFGEYGGAYVTHCHNTVHEDNAMLMRYDVYTDPNNPKNSQTHTTIIPTPNPTPDGVTYLTPEILPEGNPFANGFDPFPST